MSNEIAKFLSSVDIFSALDEESINTVASEAKQEVVGPSRIIFSKGDEGNRVYVIWNGSVEVGVDMGNRFSRFARLGPGEVFGELSLFDEKERSATARVTGDSPAKLLYFKKDNFLDLVKHNLQIGHPILIGITEKLSSRLRRADNTLRSLHSSLKRYTRNR